MMHTCGGYIHVRHDSKGLTTSVGNRIHEVGLAVTRDAVVAPATFAYAEHCSGTHVSGGKWRWRLTGSTQVTSVPHLPQDKRLVYMVMFVSKCINMTHIVEVEGMRPKPGRGGHVLDCPCPWQAILLITFMVQNWSPLGTLEAPGMFILTVTMKSTLVMPYSSPHTVSFLLSQLTPGLPRYGGSLGVGRRARGSSRTISG